MKNKQISGFIIILSIICFLIPAVQARFISDTSGQEYQELVKRAVELMKINKFQDALSYLHLAEDNRSLISQTTDSKRYLNTTIALAYYRLNQIEKALGYYINTLQWTSNTRDTIRIIVFLYSKIGKKEEALKWAHHAETTNTPQIKEDYYYFASLFGEAKNFRRALAYYSNILVLFGNEVNAVMGMANCHLELGEYDAAKRLLKRLLMKLENNPVVLNALAIVYFKQRMFMKAESIFQKVIELSPNYWPAFYNLSCVYAQSGNKEKTLETLEKAIKLGFRDFDGVMKDSDFGDMRNTPEFKALIEKYSQQTHN